MPQPLSTLLTVAEMFNSHAVIYTIGVMANSTEIVANLSSTILNAEK